MYAYTCEHVTTVLAIQEAEAGGLLRLEFETSLGSTIRFCPKKLKERKKTKTKNPSTSYVVRPKGKI